MKHKIKKADAEQMLDILNDRISNGDMEIRAISPEKAGVMSRSEMNEFLFDLFEEIVKLRIAPDDDAERKKFERDYLCTHGPAFAADLRRNELDAYTNYGVHLRYLGWLARSREDEQE